MANSELYYFCFMVVFTFQDEGSELAGKGWQTVDSTYDSDATTGKHIYTFNSYFIVDNHN